MKGLMLELLLGFLALCDVPQVRHVATDGGPVPQVAHDGLYVAPGAVGVGHPELDAFGHYTAGQSRDELSRDAFALVGVNERCRLDSDDLVGGPSDERRHRRARKIDRTIL